MTTATQTLQTRRKAALGPAYVHFYETPVHIVKGEGVWLWDAAGRKYLDCYNNVASVGHCHPHVVDALCRQARRLNTHTRYLHDSIVEYAEMLANILPGDISVSNIVCTGSEANDLACQIAAKVTGKRGFIVIRSAYHGGTMFLSALSPEDPAQAVPDHVARIDAPDTYRGLQTDTPQAFADHYATQVHEAIETLNARVLGVAALIIDSSYDNPGIFAPPPAYQQQLFAAVRAAGGLIIADEVQSGLCRLGSNYWGVMDSGVTPDFITMGKPMGDGHPIAVTATTPAIMQAFVDAGGAYFNTYAGNPVSCEVGKAVLEVVARENLLKNVQDISARLIAGLNRLALRHDIIGDVRGKGFFLGVDLVRDRATKSPAGPEAARVVEWAKDTGLLISRLGHDGNILKIRPPLVFGREHCDIAIDILDSALARA